MRNITIAVFVILLAGCDQWHVGQDMCHNQYDTLETIYGITGLSLLPAEKAYITFPEMEKVYIEVEQCTELSAPGPQIEYTSFSFLGLGPGWAATRYVDHTIMVNNDDIGRNCISDRDALRHEYIHHLLDMNGMVRDHSSPLFEKCGLGVATCNGEPCDGE